MVQDVGFWEAVGLWWDGQNLEDFTMHGLHMLWWARIGKYLQFIGGAVVVVDLVGPDRFKRLARRIEVLRRVVFSDLLLRLRIALVFIFVGMIPFLAVVISSIFGGWFGGVNATPEQRSFIAIGFGSSIGMIMLAGVAIRIDSPLVWFSRLVALGRHGNAWKWIAFVLVIVGFHLDLLGS